MKGQKLLGADHKRKTSSLSLVTTRHHGRAMSKRRSRSQSSTYRTPRPSHSNSLLQPRPWRGIGTRSHTCPVPTVTEEMDDGDSYAATYLNNALHAKHSGIKEIAKLREAIKWHSKKVAELRAQLKSKYLDLMPAYDAETDDDLRLQNEYIQEDLLQDPGLYRGRSR